MIIAFTVKELIIMQTNSGNKALEEFIKKTRISNNVTSSKMANKLKMPESSYLMYESGE